MSFSRRTKEEIIENKSIVKHFPDDVLLGLLCCSNTLNKEEFRASSNNKNVIKLFTQLLSKKSKTRLSFTTNENKKALNSTELTLADPCHAGLVFEVFFGILNNQIKAAPNQQAFITGVFLACGSVTNPNKSYHLEFTLPSDDYLEVIIKNVSSHINIKSTIRKDKTVLYCKDSQEITDVLAMIGASNSALEYINAEMFKSVMNNANRVTNFETANISKTVTASTSQVDDIRFLLKNLSEEELDEQLLKTAKIRLNNPYSSLRELAELFNPPISRSGLYHRLKALTKKANELREQKQEDSNV